MHEGLRQHTPLGPHSAPSLEDREITPETLREVVAVTTGSIPGMNDHGSTEHRHMQKAMDWAVEKAREAECKKREQRQASSQAEKNTYGIDTGVDEEVTEESE